MYIKLPDYVSERKIEVLVRVLANALTKDDKQPIRKALDGCNLQPTSRAALLAAEAAVCVLLAHEVGQEGCAICTFKPPTIPTKFR